MKAILSSILTILILFPGCSRGPLAGRGSGTLVMGVAAPPESLNPYLTTSALGRWVGDLLFLRLAREEAEFIRYTPRFAPALAERWEVKEGGKEIVFHLDPRARWSDGTQVSAEDVVFTWRAQMDPTLAWGGRASKRDIEAVEALDARRVRFRFKRRSPTALMDAVEGNILPAHRLRGLPVAQWARAEWGKFLIFSGPFAVGRWSPQDSIILDANPRYLFEETPLLSRLELRVIPDEAARTAQLLAGDLDMVDDLSAEDFARARADKRLRCGTLPDLYYAYVGWNFERPPLGEVEVRRALAMAIDRQGMIREILGGAGRIASGPLLSLSLAHDPAVRPLPHSRAEARRLLDSVGFRDRDGDGVLERAGHPFRMQIEVLKGSPLRERVALRVHADLKELGVDVDVKPRERADFTERLRRGEFDAYVSAWAPEARIDLAPLFHSRSIGDSLNYVRLADPRLDELIDQARRAEDQRAMVAGWRAVERRVADIQPYAFLFERDRMVAVDARFEDVRYDSRGTLAMVEHWRVGGSR